MRSVIRLFILLIIIQHFFVYADPPAKRIITLQQKNAFKNEVFRYLRYFRIPTDDIELSFSIVENDNILFNGKKILIFDENEEKTLKYIINKTNKTGVGTDELFDIIENGSQSFDNKRKRLSIILNNINLKLRAVTNIPEDMIQSVPSKEDNRLRNYRLNKKLFEK